MPEMNAGLEKLFHGYFSQNSPSWIFRPAPQKGRETVRLLRALPHSPYTAFHDKLPEAPETYPRPTGADIYIQKYI
jgi:hypothetical protein